jgi:26S proteasome regulatory subunit N5
VELILEQMRYCLAKNDYIRTQIISKKISVKFFDAEDTHDLKMKFYRLMVEMDQHEGNYLNICRHYRAMLNTPKDTALLSDQERKELMKYAVVYNLLSPFDNEQSDLLHRLIADKLAEEIPIHK